MTKIFQTAISKKGAQTDTDTAAKRRRSTRNVKKRKGERERGNEMMETSKSNKKEKRGMDKEKGQDKRD